MGPFVCREGRNEGPPEDGGICEGKGGYFAVVREGGEKGLWEVREKGAGVDKREMQ